MGEAEITKKRLEEIDKLYLEKCEENNEIRKQIRENVQQNIEEIMEVACDKICKHGYMKIMSPGLGCSDCPLEKKLREKMEGLKADGETA